MSSAPRTLSPSPGSPPSPRRAQPHQRARVPSSVDGRGGGFQKTKAATPRPAPTPPPRPVPRPRRRPRAAAAGPQARLLGICGGASTPYSVVGAPFRPTGHEAAPAGPPRAAGLRVCAKPGPPRRCPGRRCLGVKKRRWGLHCRPRPCTSAPAARAQAAPLPHSSAPSLQQSHARLSPRVAQFPTVSAEPLAGLERRTAGPGPPPTFTGPGRGLGGGWSASGAGRTLRRLVRGGRTRCPGGSLRLARLGGGRSPRGCWRAAPGLLRACCEIYREICFYNRVSGAARAS